MNIGNTKGNILVGRWHWRYFNELTCLINSFKFVSSLKCSIYSCIKTCVVSFNDVGCYSTTLKCLSWFALNPLLWKMKNIDSLVLLGAWILEDMHCINLTPPKSGRDFSWFIALWFFSSQCFVSHCVYNNTNFGGLCWFPHYIYYFFLNIGSLLICRNNLTNFLQKLFVSRLYDLTEIEGLQLAICSILDIFCMLSDLSKVHLHYYVNLY